MDYINMNIFELKSCPNGDWYLDHSSPMYPVKFEEKINQLAGEKITACGPEKFFGGFCNSFVIKYSKIQLFQEKVLPFIGFKNGNEETEECAQIWDKDEQMEANLI